jgi:flagellin
METQIRGFEQGIDNTQDMQNLINTAEGALQGISENLNRIRELTIQAANGTNSASDRQLIQTEIDQLVNEIGDVANRAQFNQIDLLNGTTGDLPTASAADGSGPTVSLPDMSQLADDLRSINVVTGNINDNLDIIDQAQNNVSAARAELGTMSNRMDHTINSNSITMLNQAASKSRIADADMGKETTDSSRDQVINDMQILMQRQQQEQEERKTQVFM